MFSLISFIPFFFSFLSLQPLGRLIPHFCGAKPAIPVTYFAEQANIMLFKMSNMVSYQKHPLNSACLFEWHTATNLEKSVEVIFSNFSRAFDGVNNCFVLLHRLHSIKYVASCLSGYRWLFYLGLWQSMQGTFILKVIVVIVEYLRVEFYLHFCSYSTYTADLASLLKIYSAIKVQMQTT